MSTSEPLAPFRYVTPETLDDDLRTGHVNVHPIVADGLRGAIGRDIDFVVAESPAGEPRGQVGINWKAPVTEEARTALGLGPDEHVPNIAFVEVPDGYKGRGIGGVLFDAVLAEVARRGHERVFLTVEPDNAGAIRFYERRGFEDIHQRISATQFEQSPDGTYGEPVIREQDVFVRTFQPGEFSQPS